MRNDSVAKPVDANAFRQTMGLFPTGVMVVSAMSDTGEPRGFTANSLVSVSLDPMLICWSIQNASSQFSLYSEAQEFAVSLLSAEQHGIASRYASRGASDQSAQDFVMSENGLPIIANALASLECRQWSLVPAGDHTMIFGEVTAVQANQDEAPLGFFKGAFCQIAQ